MFSRYTSDGGSQQDNAQGDDPRSRGFSRLLSWKYSLRDRWGACEGKNFKSKKVFRQKIPA